MCRISDECDLAFSVFSDHRKINVSISVGFTIGFSQPLYMSGEGDGSVQVCAELISGNIPVSLGMVSLSVMADLGSSSGKLEAITLVAFTKYYFMRTLRYQ